MSISVDRGWITGAGGGWSGNSGVPGPVHSGAWGATDGATYPGGLVPNPFGQEGYKMAFTTKCTQCHTQVHGTDLPSQAVPSLGRGLAR